MKKSLPFLLLLVSAMGNLFSRQNDFPRPTGPYLGQKPPTAVAELFAPGFVSTGLSEGEIAFRPDGRECFWAVSFSGYETILTSRLENDKWTEPEVASFAGQYFDGWPAMQPDGKRMFFHSARPLAATTAATARFNIWYVDRGASGWGEPQEIGAPINGGENAACPSITRDGTIYLSKRFSDGSEKICRSRLEQGKYRELEILPAVINAGKDNFHAVISPDESYLIKPVFGAKDTIGGDANYYVFFRNRTGGWSEPVNLGKGVNSPYCGGTPSISADGRFLFFQAAKPAAETFAFGRRLSLPEMIERENRNPSIYTYDIYWLDAKIIEALRPKE
jgi:hypothetical protein